MCFLCARGHSSSWTIAIALLSPGDFCLSPAFSKSVAKISTSLVMSSVIVGIFFFGLRVYMKVPPQLYRDELMMQGVDNACALVWICYYVIHVTFDYKESLHHARRRVRACW